MIKKYIEKRKLTKKQTEALNKHSKLHTSRHMAFMRKKMKEGTTFTKAHKDAMKKVGK